jgi:hypothetical protein
MEALHVHSRLRGVRAALKPKIAFFPDQLLKAKYLKALGS